MDKNEAEEVVKNTIEYANEEIKKSKKRYLKIFLSCLLALLVCIAAWVVMGRDSIASIGKVEPKYVLLGGVIGAIITWTVIKSIDTLGPAKATLFIIVAQITMSYLIELFGLFGMDKQPFEWKKIIGLAAALVGIVIFQWEG